MKYDVFFYEAFEEEQEKLKHYLPENIKAGFTWKTIQEYGEPEPQSSLISIRTQSDLPPNWAHVLDGIISRSTGYDHLIKYRKNVDCDLALGYLPLYCHRAVAEQGIMLMMALFRKLPLQMKNFDDFNRDGLTGFEIEGKTLIVYGVGNIGSQVVKIGEGLGMQVYGIDIEEKHDFVNYISPEKGFDKADAIICSMNLTNKNINYFNYNKLKQCKKKPVFINVARGELSFAYDLQKALDEELISAVALDVFNEEGNLADFLRSGKEIDSQEIRAIKNLRSRTNVILTPHNSFNTQESVQRKSEQTVQQIQYFLANQEFYWKVPQE